MSSINPLRDNCSEGSDYDYVHLIMHYVVPGMIILAIVGIILIQLNNGGLGSTDTGVNQTQIFQALGQFISTTSR